MERSRTLNKKNGDAVKLAAVAAAAFALAFVLAWLMFGAGQSGAVREEEPPTRPGRTLGEAEMKPFLDAARSGDFKAMAAAGGELFIKGDVIPDRESLFAEYAVDSFPPFQVYAFYTAAAGGYVYRVLLTLDENNKVESFMAEEMPVVK